MDMSLIIIGMINFCEEVIQTTVFLFFWQVMSEEYCYFAVKKVKLFRFFLFFMEFKFKKAGSKYYNNEIWGVRVRMLLNFSDILYFWSVNFFLCCCMMFMICNMGVVDNWVMEEGNYVSQLSLSSGGGVLKFMLSGSLMPSGFSLFSSLNFSMIFSSDGKNGGVSFPWFSSNRIVLWLCLIILWIYGGFYVYSSWVYGNNKEGFFSGGYGGELSDGNLEV